MNQFAVHTKHQYMKMQGFCIQFVMKYNNNTVIRYGTETW